MNPILIIDISIVTLFVLNMFSMDYVLSLSTESMEQSVQFSRPGTGDDFQALAASNSTIAIIILIVFVGGPTCALGYYIYKIFKHK